MKRLNTRVIHFAVQYGLLRTLIGIFILMDPERASRWGGRLGRYLGPLFKSNKLALKHMQNVLPGKAPKDYKKNLAGMWDNLGRMIAELPDLETLSDNVEIVDMEHLVTAITHHGQAIVFSGHIGNWEIMAPALLHQSIPVDLVYRPPNNPFVGKMLDKYRSLGGQLRLLPKSRSGTRQLVKSIMSGRTVGILIDQKYNEGMEVPFFGRPAMTSPAFVQLGQRYNCPVIPFRVERLQGTQFRLSFYPPLKLHDDTGAERPVTDVIADAHTLLESWITERPDQWLWLHQRWKKTSDTD